MKLYKQFEFFWYFPWFSSPKYIMKRQTIKGTLMLFSHCFGQGKRFWSGKVLEQDLSKNFQIVVWKDISELEFSYKLSNEISRWGRLKVGKQKYWLRYVKTSLDQNVTSPLFFLVGSQYIIWMQNTCKRWVSFSYKW